MRKRISLLALSLALSLLAACGEPTPEPPSEPTAETNQAVMEDAQWADEAQALVDSPAAVSPLLLPEASGRAVEKNQRAEIDYSNLKDGYVMAQFTGQTNTRLKVQVAGPTTTYTYDLPVQGWATFPLSDGNGDYSVTVFENTSGTKYATVLTASFPVALEDEFAPFLRPNQYVNYQNAVNSIAKAAQLTQGVADPLVKVEKIYQFVVNNVTYDQQKAATVQSGYLPVLDETLATGKGICFDYAALMAGMLRSQGVPCKLVVGYAGTVYHAWISVWTAETGWIDGAVYFDGASWHRMDPTFISSGGNSAAIQQYVGNGSNYNAMYLY